MYKKSRDGDIEEFVNTYPVIDFKLGSHGEALFKLFPREWMVRYPIKGKPDEFKLCPAFRGRTFGNSALIGNQFMKHYDFHFDREHKIMSFVRSQCDESGVKLRKFVEKKKVD